MRVDSYIGTYYPDSAGDMLELETIRKAVSYTHLTLPTKA